MSKVWLKTPNDRIVNLHNYAEFEKKEKSVFGIFSSGISDKLGNFESEEDASEFLMDIFCCLEDEDE